MPRPLAPFSTSYAAQGMVCSVDALASSAGIGVLRDGGNAVDAAIAASSVLAVTWQHACGIGGDLFALVHLGGTGAPRCLNAAGRAPSGASAAQLRAEGHTDMPMQGDLRAVTIPGCIDGWTTLHAELGRLPLDRVLADALRLATDGFPASPTLGLTAPRMAEVSGADDYLTVRRPGDSVRRPRIAAHLQAVLDRGRAGFYEGSFGAALVDLDPELFDPSDLRRSQADWVEPLGLDVWGHRVWTVPPPSQGYLSLLSAGIAEGLDVPDDPASDAWAHLLIEASRAAGHDRIERLHDGADGTALIDRAEITDRRARIDPAARADVTDLVRGGGTIYLNAADAGGMAVSLIQSNAEGWGVGITADGVFLHNRGNGFSIVEDHPAEYAPGRRPPHTLAPAVVTRPDGAVRAVLGTMGGDSQPQIVLQMLTRLLRNEQSPSAVIGGPRWVLDSATNGFRLWAGQGPTTVRAEASGGDTWASGLRERGHEVEVVPDSSPGFGHAHLIEVNPAGGWRGAADPRALSSAAAVY